MSRASTLILLGSLTILFPFSGLPSAFRTLALAVLGACVLGIGLAMRARDVRELRAKTAVPAEPAAPQGVSPI